MVWFPPAKMYLVLSLCGAAEVTAIVQPGYAAMWCACPSPWTSDGMTPHPLREKVTGPSSVPGVSLIDWATYIVPPPPPPLAAGVPIAKLVPVSVETLIIPEPSPVLQMVVPVTTDATVTHEPPFQY